MGTRHEDITSGDTRLSLNLLANQSDHVAVDCHEVGSDDDHLRLLVVQYECSDEQVVMYTLKICNPVVKAPHVSRERRDNTSFCGSCTQRRCTNWFIAAKHRGTKDSSENQTMK